jgi:hypothetical protein
MGTYEKKLGAERFNIPEEEILWYGYSKYFNRIWVKTIESANKVSYQVNYMPIEGGKYEGEMLGTIIENQVGEQFFDITC